MAILSKNSKSEIPNSKPKFLQSCLGFGELGFKYCLEFGTWNLGFYI